MSEHAAQIYAYLFINDILAVIYKHKKTKVKKVQV